MSASAIGSSTTRTAAEQKEQGQLGKDEFLKLLMAQLANQDPLSPMDGQAFVAQLAQFATVEQLQGSSQRLDGLLMAQAAGNQLSAASLVGKEATFANDQVSFDGENACGIAGSLPKKAATVTAVIKDANGKTVRTMDLGSQPAGRLSAAWDGRDDSGNLVAKGDYTVQLTAADAEGKSIDLEAWGRGRIDGVSFENGYAELLVGDARIKLADVLEINAVG